MFYKPNYCCECGDKIERDEWKFLTSRRFCENFKDNFRWQEWLPGISIAAGILGIIIGFGAWLKKPERAVNLVSDPASSNKNQNPSNQSTSRIPTNNNVQTIVQNGVTNQNVIRTNSQNQTVVFGQTPPLIKQNSSEVRQNSVLKAVYICGAQTKKGTACLRRVKSAGRCWQHVGQSAILPPEKLLVSE